MPIFVTHCEQMKETKVVNGGERGENKKKKYNNFDMLSNPLKVGLLKKFIKNLLIILHIVDGGDGNNL